MANEPASVKLESYGRYRNTEVQGVETKNDDAFFERVWFNGYIVVRQRRMMVHTSRVWDRAVITMRDLHLSHSFACFGECMQNACAIAEKLNDRYQKE